LRAYQQQHRQVFPINRKADQVEGLEAYSDLGCVPEPIHGISVVTPPSVTESVVEEAGNLGIQHIWMQPGAESDEAVARAKQLGANVIYGGPCILVVFGYRESGVT